MLALLIREGGCCLYCDRIVTNYRATFSGMKMPTHSATIDHIIPRSMKGPTTIENCVLACDGCNRKRGLQDASVFLFWRLRHPAAPLYVPGKSMLPKKKRRRQAEGIGAGLLIQADVYASGDGTPVSPPNF